MSMLPDPVEPVLGREAGRQAGRQVDRHHDSIEHHLGCKEWQNIVHTLLQMAYS